MQKIIKADKSMNNRKIEYILSGNLGFSANIIKKLKQTNGVWINGEKARLNCIVHEGDEVVITIPEGDSGSICPENILLDILYEDENILAVNKPRGMMTHPSKEHYTNTLANGVVYYLKNASFRVITRLDKDTSGVVLIAKNHLSAHKLNEAMRQGKIKKEYVALVTGSPNPLKGTIDAPIARGDGMRRIVHVNGKSAITNYAVEKTCGELSLVRLEPVTGRTHQLRVHMQYMGTPIYGDSMYGELISGERTRLHCRKIEFLHPYTKMLVAITAPVPDDINKVIENNN